MIEYIIDGIDDNSSDKAVLYGVDTIKEFKIKLRHFEKMREKMTAKITKDKEGKKIARKDNQN